MTDAEAIAAVRAGGRCETGTTIHGLKEPPNAPVAGCQHRWRTVACDFELDVVECDRCGAQRVVACNFDEECA